jgi:hypothetical protein
VTFAIAGDLVHEAWSTARAQRETGERVLREFVRLAARSLSYKAQSPTGICVLRAARLPLPKAAGFATPYSRTPAM